MTVSPSFSLLMKYLLFPVYLQSLILFLEETITMYKDNYHQEDRF